MCRRHTTALASDIDDTLYRTNIHYIRRICKNYAHPSRVGLGKLWMAHRHITTITFYSTADMVAVMQKWIVSNEFQHAISILNYLYEHILQLGEMSPIAAHVTSRLLARLCAFEGTSILFGSISCPMKTENPIVCCPMWTQVYNSFSLRVPPVQVRTGMKEVLCTKEDMGGRPR